MEELKNISVLKVVRKVKEILNIKKIIEIYNDEIIKIRAYTMSDDYCEIRYKDNYLDVRAAKNEIDPLRVLYYERFKNGLETKNNQSEIDYIINHLGIRFNGEDDL